MITPCSKLWTDINLNIHRKEVVNCCKRQQLETPTVEELSDPKFWTERKELREAKNFWIKNYNFPKGCEACSTNHPNSQYNTWNNWLGKDTPDLTKDHSYKIEIALSSKCNQTCIYCIPEVSSLWAKKLGVPILQPDSVWQEAALTSLYKHIENNTGDKESVIYTFLGGETFLIDEFLDIVEHLASIHNKRQQRCVMQFISNLNLGPSVVQKFINVCKKYPYVVHSLNASIDNIGIRAEAIREGLDFARFEHNLNWIMSEPAVTRVSLLPTMSALSITDHVQFLDWATRLIYKHRDWNSFGKTWALSINSLTEPKAMHPAILPIEYTSYIDDAVEYVMKLKLKQKHLYVKHLQDIRNQIGTRRDKQYLEKAFKWYKNQEKLHNKNYWEIFPELEDIFNENTNTN